MLFELNQYYHLKLHLMGQRDSTVSSEFALRVTDPI